MNGGHWKGKKNMKKLLAIVLAAMMVIATGCGDKDPPSDPDANIHADSTENSESILKDPPASNKTDDKLDEADDSAEDNQNDADRDIDSSIMGSIKGDVYINEFADFSFTLPGGWTFSSKEDLDALMSQAGEEAELTTVYDCMALNADSTANVLIMFENTAVTGNADISEKDYADSVTTLLTSGQASDWKYEVVDASKADISGKTYYTTTVSADTGIGVDTEQTLLFRKLGDYMLSICVSTYPGITESAQDIIAAIGNADAKPSKSQPAAANTFAFDKGSVSGNAYINKFAGISVIIPSSWKFYSDEELAEYNELYADSDGSETYTCVAVDEYDIAELSVSFVDLTALDAVGMTAKELGDSLAEAAVSVYEDSTNELVEKSDIVISGKTYYRTLVKVDFGDGTVMQLQCLYRNIGSDTVLCITTYTFQDVTESYDEVLGFISSLEMI